MIVVHTRNRCSAPAVVPRKALPALGQQRLPHNGQSVLSSPKWITRSHTSKRTRTIYSSSACPSSGPRSPPPQRFCSKIQAENCRVSIQLTSQSELVLQDLNLHSDKSYGDTLSEQILSKRHTRVLLLEKCCQSQLVICSPLPYDLVHTTS